MQVRPLLLGCLAVLALVGLALAADAQRDTFLNPDSFDTGFADRDGAAVSGNVVALTAIIVALAVTTMAGMVATVGWRARLLPLFVVFLATYIVVFMLQTMMPSYQAVDVARTAVFAISPVIVNAVASPSVFVAPLALLMAAALGLGAAARRLQGRHGSPQDPLTALQMFVGAMALATPFLVITAVGSIRLLMALDPQGTDTLPYLISLPLGALAGLALLVVGSIKAWHLGQFVRHGRVGPIAAEAWDGLRKAELVIMGVIGGLGLLAMLFAEIKLDILEAGRVFGMSTRTHTQAQVLLLVLLVPWWSLHRPILRIFDDHRGHNESLDVSGPHPVLQGYWIAGGIGAGLAILSTIVIPGALWPWLSITLPLAIFSLIRLRAMDAVLPTLLAAIVLWSIGNTVSGIVELRETVAGITFDTAPGLLALWRVLAVTLAAIAASRLARTRAQGMRRGIAWPLTSGLGAAFALIIFLELPFSAWVDSTAAGDYVGIGTVVASQQAAVRGVLHGLAGLAAFAAGMAIARLSRPDWFGHDDGAPAPHVAGLRASEAPAPSQPPGEA